LPAGLLALAQALSVTERQLHGSLLNIRRVVSRICGALFRGSLAQPTANDARVTLAMSATSRAISAARLWNCHVRVHRLAAT
ncbi:hypothetical protein, partial [Xanthomonas campestris]